MAKFNPKFQNIMLALGILLLLCGVVWIFTPPAEQFEMYHFVPNAIFLLLTAVFVYFSLLVQNSVSFYISLNLCLFSLLWLILAARATPVSFKQYWPVIVITAGITLLPVGRIHYKKFRMAYAIPSAALTVLGVFFLLFTFKIIKVPMRVFFNNCFPIIFIMGGVFLIVLYYVKKNNKQIFPDEDYKYDDYDDYSEDDE